MNFDALIRNWSYKTHDGKPDVGDSVKRIILQELLEQEGWPKSTIDHFLTNLQEGSKIPDETIIRYRDSETGKTETMPAGSAKRMKPNHPAKIAYDKMVGMQGDDDAAGAGGGGGRGQGGSSLGMGADAAALQQQHQDAVKARDIEDLLNNPEPGSDNAELKSDEVEAHEANLFVAGNFNPDVLGKEGASHMNKLLASVEAKKGRMSEEQYETAVAVLTDLSVVYNSSVPRIDKLDILSNLSLGRNLDTHKNRKLYLNDVEGMEGLLGAPKSSQAVVKMLQKYGDQYVPVEKSRESINNSLTRNSKPDLGAKHIQSAYDKDGNVLDPNVAKIFSMEPLNRLAKREFQALYGPKGENGYLLVPPSKHAAEHLKFSVTNNRAIQGSMNALKNLAKRVDDPAEADSLKRMAGHIASFRREMINLENASIPSEEAERQVNANYAKLFDSLMNENPSYAPALLKNFAEMRMYESALAAGKDAYLPSAGNFPAGDVIVSDVGRESVQQLSFLSVKYGKNSRGVYGCPADSKTLQRLHPDPAKQDLQGKHIGQEGYTLLIKDDLIKDKNTTKETLRSMLAELPDAGGQFSDKELDELSDLIQDYKIEVSRLIGQVKGPRSKMLKSSKQKLAQELRSPNGAVATLAGRMKRIVTETKLGKIIGDRNASKIYGNAGFGPAQFLSGLTLANQIVTSNGFEGITHNKQYYDKGTMRSVTQRGTTNLNDWHLGLDRVYPGTSPRGAQIGFTGAETAREQDMIQLEED